jgi:hypothetical protein
VSLLPSGSRSRAPLPINLPSWVYPSVDCWPYFIDSGVPGRGRALDLPASWMAATYYVGFVALYDRIDHLLHRFRRSVRQDRSPTTSVSSLRTAGSMYYYVVLVAPHDGIDLLLCRFRRSVWGDRYVTSPSVSSLCVVGSICYCTKSAAPDRARLRAPTMTVRLRLRGLHWALKQTAKRATERAMLSRRVSHVEPQASHWASRIEPQASHPGYSFRPLAVSQ